MWTEITRPQYQRDGLRYASDTTDGEWAVIAALMPPPHKGRGRRRTTPLRAVVNAIFYIAQSGCQWRMLPKDFPPFTTVQHYFYPWRDNGLWRQINHVLLMLAREVVGRDASPSAGVIVRRGHRPPGSSIASRSRPPRPAAREGMTPVRRSKAASATS